MQHGQRAANPAKLLRRAAKRKPTESLDSYDCCLQGMACAYRGELRKAADFHQQAIEKDPEYAEAYGLAAQVHCAIQAFEGVTLDPGEKNRAIEFARRAAVLGSDDALCLARAAQTLAYLGKEYERATALIEQAIVLNPNLAMVWKASGWISVINCDSERAIESFSRVTQLSPVDPSRSDAWNGISWAYFIAGSYDEGCLWATRALQHSSNAMSLGAFTANAVLAGRSSEAQEAAKHLGEIAPTFCASHAGDTIVFREPVVAAKMRAALRQAGLPD